MSISKFIFTMIGMFALSMPLLLFPNSSQAQNAAVKRSHSLNQNVQLKKNAPNSLTLVAVRVQFKKDSNDLTTGDGTFDADNLDYLDDSDIAIDPLPHDKSYFKNHLEFAKNYFETVSGQQMQVSYRLSNTIYQLDKKMSAYSPTGQSFSNTKVANLIRDTWKAVKEQGGVSTSGLDPQKTAFIIFHAGVGRDVELTGTNLAITPQDIPSLYLGENTLESLLGRPNFDGFNVNNSSFKVTSSMVMPQTLSRPGENAVGKEFVLQLSINGLLAASVGSYLGLPDLFNTKTGDSGIGRFGLMDGESFFSYRGLFPPEPSAWEKSFLGWQSPFQISKNTSGSINLDAASLHQGSSIAKYNLSGSEYFLIENRHRNPAGSGLSLTFKQPNGNAVTKNFTNNDQTFVNQSDGFTDLLPKGVVTKASNYDWSLPGGLDIGKDGEPGTADDRFLNGGILIWHIDRAIINQNLSSQTVNANPKRRGVDLEEADGAQDIGRAATSDLSNQARGTAFDFWWKGNDASVIIQNSDTLQFYNNKFGPNSRPSNESNSGAPSYFQLYDFSPTQPTASFRIRPASGNDIESVSLALDEVPDQAFTTPEQSYYASYPLQLSVYHTQADSFLIVPARQSTYALNLADNANAPLFDFQTSSVQQPYLDNKVVLGEQPIGNQIKLNAWSWNGSSWNDDWSTTASANNAFISSNTGQTLSLDFTDQQVKAVDGTIKNPLSDPLQKSETVNGTYSAIRNGQLSVSSSPKSFTLSSNGSRKYTGFVKLSNKKNWFYLLTDDRLLLFNSQKISQPKTVVSETEIGWPAMADINNSGELNFIYVNKETGKLEARNSNGGMVAYFPIVPPENSSFTGTPLVAQGNGSDSPHIYITAQDSLGLNIYGYNHKGEELQGFPLYVGGISKSKNQPVNPVLSGQNLYAVSHNGDVKSWKLANITKVLWGGRYGNNPKNKVSGRISNSSGTQNPVSNNQLLEKKETYNWPNPADGFTNLRFQTNKASTVDLKIITAGGNVVHRQQFQSPAGPAQDHRISTKEWSSGLYLAMITARAGSKKERKMIKIVVVH